MMHPQMANHPGFQHVRHGTPSGSPPMHNGAMPQFNRGPSPLPPGVSRPSSRNAQHPPHTAQQHLRRTSSNLAPQGHHPGQPQPGYAYSPNPPFYNPQAGGQVQRPPGQPMPQGSTYPPPYPPPQAVHPQMQQAYMQDNRRSSMPPQFPQPPPQANMQRHPSQEHLQPPHPRPQPSPQPQQQQRPNASPQPPQGQFQSPPMSQPKPLPAHAKSHSIFTPIDDSRSLLAQHWGATGNAEAPRSDPASRTEDGGPRSASIDVAAMQRENQARANGSSPRAPAMPPPKSPQPPQRTASTPNIAPPAKASSAQPDAKRPRLKVQIPSEQSGDEAGTAESGQDDASTSQTGTQSGTAQPGQPPHGVVLPPPSPSAGALLSAGAQGPPNPFARPAPPMSTNPHAANRDAATTNNHVETPISALPSRFMNDNLLPSPSSFYPEWGFGRSGDSNMLPSPLNFQTPVVQNGSGWREEERKRGNDEQEGGDQKRTKT